jgi:hypothetical protein
MKKSNKEDNFEALGAWKKSIDLCLHMSMAQISIG